MLFKTLKVLTLFSVLISLNASAKIKHLRVIFEKKPTKEVLVAWTTPKLKPYFHNVIYFDTQPRLGNVSKYRFKKRASKNFQAWYGADTVHKARVKKLKPDTRYYFVVKSGKHVSKEHYFITAPRNPAKSFKLLFGGDSRSDRVKRRELNSQIKSLFEANPDIYALVHGGDYIHNGFNWGEWKDWFQDHYHLTTTSSGRILPIVPTRGNHEASLLLYNQLFGYPGGLKNYFVTEIAGLALFTLNTNIPMGGFQKKWLKKNLKRYSKSHKWIMANYHAPAWPGVKKPSRAKKHWVPYFERYQADLVFESDGHVLKKTAPIYKNRIDEKRGIIYVGEGGLGVKQRRPTNASKWYLQAPGYSASEHHVMLLNVGSKTSQLQVILADGSLYDEFTMHPRKR